MTPMFKSTAWLFFNPIVLTACWFSRPIPLLRTLPFKCLEVDFPNRKSDRCNGSLLNRWYLLHRFRYGF